jgi:hypothetical protein
MNVIAGIVPASLWQKPGFLNVMGAAASLMLGAGHLGLSGKVHFPVILTTTSEILSLNRSTGKSSHRPIAISSNQKTRLPNGKSGFLLLPKLSKLHPWDFPSGDRKYSVPHRII